VAALVGGTDGLEVKCELLLPATERSAQALLPMVSELLHACHWLPSEIDLVCVTTGPGSFTGLRIGVTAAKTFAFAVNAKLVGVHTLAALAASVPNRTGRVWAILDAQRQELFVANFEGGQIPHVPETRILGIDNWLTELRVGDSVVGPPLAQLAERLPTGITTVDTKFWQPQASEAGQLGYKLFQAGELVDPVQLVPNYYRKSAAEEKVLQTKQK
jgi:tRNA threonylcarbamoyladenosine biosynthesis protein TsaB